MELFLCWCIKKLFHIPVVGTLLLSLSEAMSVAGRTVSIASKTDLRASGAVSVLVCSI